MNKYLNINENIKLNTIILERFKTQNFNYKKEEYNYLIKKAIKNILNDENMEPNSQIPVF